MSRFHAIAGTSPSPTLADEAYSICRTRLGASDCDFDDAGTIRGRMAGTPAWGTRQSTVVTGVERSWSASSLGPNGVSPRKRTPRSIFRYRAVKMRQHPTPCTLESMSVDHAIFHRPGPSARSFTPLPPTARPYLGATPPASWPPATCRRAPRETGMPLRLEARARFS